MTAPGPNKLSSLIVRPWGSHRSVSRAFSPVAPFIHSSGLSDAQLGDSVVMRFALNFISVRFSMCIPGALPLDLVAEGGGDTAG